MSNKPGVYTIKEIKENQQGLYICVVFGFWKTIEIEHYVQVFDNSKIKKQDTVQQTLHWIDAAKIENFIFKKLGDDVWLKCKPKENLKSNITWYKNLSEKLIYQNWSLLLHNVRKEHTANYTCVVCNSAECIYRTFRLFVLGKNSDQNFGKKCFSFIFSRFKLGQSNC